MTQEVSDFATLNLSPALLKALEAIGFKTPSPVQAQTIPILLEGRDVIAQAQTGTGKTAAFALPILQRMSAHSSSTQALVLAPTRELAIQVAEQFELLSANQRISVAVLCGGQDYRHQLKQLRAGAHVVVGTPGRILDHLDRGTLQLGSLSTFVLDEADEMLRMGFIEDVETILSKLPPKKQMALFSATMPYRIRQIANNYLNNAASIEIFSETATVKSIDQRFLFASPGQKPEALIRVLATEDYQGVIVFVRTKSSTEEVAEILRQQGYRAVAINGDISQALREKVIAQFRQGSQEILVATDVAARGLDVERVTHVINYDVPHDCETYVHRIGRTGRAGRSGVTILFVTPREARILNVIERHTRQRIQKINVPNNEMILATKQNRFVTNILSRLEHPNLQDYQNIMQAFFKENDISSTQVASVLALMLNQDKPWNNLPATQFNSEERKQRNREYRDRDGREGSRDGRSKSGSFSSFGGSSSTPQRRGNKAKQGRGDYPQELYRLDVGRIHGVKPGNIVGAIANEGGLESRFITRLKIFEDHSTVCLPKGMSKEVVQDLTKAWVCGRPLKLTSLGAA